MSCPVTRYVLVVEDEPLIGMDIQDLLEDAGYQVLGPASTIEAALRYVHEYTLRAAILDVNLGGTLTEPVIDAILQTSTPVVLLTGYSSKTEAPPYSLCPIVRKPYDPSNLLQVLEYTIDHPNMISRPGTTTPLHSR